MYTAIIFSFFSRVLSILTVYFLFLFLFLHLGRAISYASYFYNPNTWFSGILLGIFLMATAFMGYVLPFGQMSFWGATVITNLLSPFPSLIEWVCGGHYVYNPTLKRFFLFHFQFPFLLCGFRILHLFLFFLLMCILFSFLYLCFLFLLFFYFLSFFFSFLITNGLIGLESRIAQRQ